MNKGFLKNVTGKTLAIGLSAVMAVSLTGCKNSGSEEKLTSNQTADKNTNASAEQTSVSEYGYNIEYIDFPEGVDGIYQPVLCDNTLYFMQNSPNGSVMIESLDLSAPEEADTFAVLEESMGMRLETSYLHSNQDGSMTFVQREYFYDIFSHQGKELDLGDIPEDDLITEEYLSILGVELSSLELEFSDITGLSVKEFAALYSSLTDSDDYIIESWGNGKVCMNTVDAAGTFISSLDITEHFKDTSSLYAAYDNEGNIYMYNQKWSLSENHLQITEYSILKVNLQTGEAKKTVIDGEISALFSVPSGDIVVIAYNMNAGNFSVKIWDREKNDFSDKEAVLSSASFKEAYAAYDDSFYYIDSAVDTLYRYDLSEQKDEEVLKFIDWDISENDMSLISYIDDTHITMVGSCVYCLTKVKASEIVKKQIITLACLYTYNDTKSYIADFNRGNSEYRIQAKTYLADNDLDAAITEFTKDILSNPPDLINLDGMDYARYSESGIFEDLYSFMQKDEEFKNKNLNQNILKLFETDGKLYALPAAYTITGLASAKSLLGDEQFTLDKYMEIAATNTDKDIFDYMSRENLLKILFSCNEDYLIDYKAKSCNFTDGTFEKILNITKDFPSEKSLRAKEAAEEYINPLQRVSEGTLLFYPMNHIYNFLEYQEADFIFDGSFNMTGYPSVEGNKIAINAYSSLYAMSSQSQYKDICWDFIKKVFNTEIETMGNIAFIVDNDLFEANLEQMAAPIMKKDADGNMAEVPQRVEEGTVQMEFYAPSEEMVAELRALIDSVNTLLPIYTAGDIYKILTEEAAPFYAGDKTAKEVCKVIQSRINILINEGN